MSGAVAHLLEAVELDPQFAEVAREDADFASVQDDPEFASAVAGKTEPSGSRS